MLRLLEDKIATPLGPLWVIADEAFNLRAVEWEEHSDRMVELLNIHYRAEGYERITARNPGGLSDKLAATSRAISALLIPCQPPRRVPLSSARCGRRCVIFPAGR